MAIIFYILVYTKIEKTFRYLFSTMEKRSEYIVQHNIEEYSLSDVEIA